MARKVKKKAPARKPRPEGVAESGPPSAFTMKAGARLRRIVTEAYVAQPFDPADPPTPPMPHHKTTALWDTGATGSVISDGLVRTLGLQPTGSASVSHAGGVGQTNLYVVNLALPNGLGVPGVQVGEFTDTGGGFGLIIGMDIISLGDFAISQNGTQVTFRIPSVGAIDFVVEADRQTFAGVGRNDPCPCGAVKNNGRTIKFKDCHLRK